MVHDGLERLLWDQSFRRIMLNTRREYNQEFWWKPGEVAPKF
jgi:hypothetical protein